MIAIWDAVYCTGAAYSPDKMTGTLPAIRSWVQKIEQRLEAPRSIFDSKVEVDRPESKQWGTGYWWLTFTTGKTYPTGDDLVEAESHGYAVTCLITNGKGKTWPWSVGLFDTKADAEKERTRLRNKFKREQAKPWPQYPNQTYRWFVRAVWKVDR